MLTNKNVIITTGSNIINVEVVTRTIKINSFFLLVDNCIIERRMNSSYETKFTIKRSALHFVQINYEDKYGFQKTFVTDGYNFNIPIKSREEYLDLIDLAFSNNKLYISFLRCADFLQKISNCIITLNHEQIFAKKNLSINTIIPILNSGEYVITFEVINSNSETVTLTFVRTFVCKELFHSLIHRDICLKSNINHRNLAVLIFQIIYAFILREFQRKYDKGYLRYFSIVLGPAVQLIILVAIFTLMGRKSVAGLGIPLFVLTGILPYTFFTSAGNCLTIVSGNRSLLSYRQVKIIDIILSSILMELLVNVIVFVGGVFICWYFGITIKIYNPLSLILAFLLLFIFTLGLSMILAVIGFYFAEFNYAIQVVFRALFYISGVFFSIENIPVQYQKYVLWNPLLQIIEFIRFSFVSFDLPHELSYLYLFKCTIVIFLIGISLYFVNRNKFMVNDRAR